MVLSARVRVGDQEAYVGVSDEGEGDGRGDLVTIEEGAGSGDLVDHGVLIIVEDKALEEKSSRSRRQ